MMIVNLMIVEIKAISFDVQVKFFSGNVENPLNCPN